jgi:hypothetical protein
MAGVDDELAPLGFVSWGGGDVLAELLPDGSWRCASGDPPAPDPEMAGALRAAYGPPTGDPADGHYGPAILEHLARATGGVWVHERTPAVGLIH